MKHFLFVVSIASSSILLRVLILFLAYFEFIRNYFPSDNVLYLYGILFCIVSLPFWLLPNTFLISKFSRHFHLVLFLSFVPEILVIVGTTLFVLLKYYDSSILSYMLVFVCLPIFLLTEVSYLVNRIYLGILRAKSGESPRGLFCK